MPNITHFCTRRLHAQISACNDFIHEHSRVKEKQLSVRLILPKKTNQICAIRGQLPSYCKIRLLPFPTVLVYEVMLSHRKFILPYLRYYESISARFFNILSMLVPGLQNDIHRESGRASILLLGYQY